MRRGPIVLAVVALLALGAGPTGAADRATADRPDDLKGAQIHVVYAVPADLADRGYDIDGTLAASVANYQAWLRGQTGGKGLRVDTYQGQVDVTFLRLAKTDAQIAATGAFIPQAIAPELAAAHLYETDKIYEVYYDGTSTYACGGASWPPAVPGHLAVMYLRSTQPGFECYVPERSRSGIAYLDFAMLHDTMHTLGLVATCAPHHVRAGHVSDGSNDLMWAGDPPDYWHPATLDNGHDDYYQAHITGCPDLADSPYLEGNEPPTPPSSPPAAAALPVAVHLSGKGKVTAGGYAFACPGPCRVSVDAGSSIAFRAVPARGWTFAGWSGACSGRGPCRVAPTNAVVVRARFVRRS